MDLSPGLLLAPAATKPFLDLRYARLGTVPPQLSPILRVEHSKEITAPFYVQLRGNSDARMYT